jgi:hypothetical protein
MEGELAVAVAVAGAVPRWGEVDPLAGVVLTFFPLTVTVGCSLNHTVSRMEAGNLLRSVEGCSTQQRSLSHLRLLHPLEVAFAVGFSAGMAAPVLLDDPVVGRVVCSLPLAVVPDFDGWYQQVISLVARVDGLDHRSIVLLAAVVEGPCLLDRLGACWEAP